MNILFIFLAKYLYLAAVALALIWFWKLPREKKRAAAIFGMITLPVIYVISKIAAAIYFDPRPFMINHFTPLVPHAPDNGFPSDHVLLVSAIASVIFPFNKKTSIVIFFIAILVGISRVYVGIHHITDIIGSVAISVGVSTLLHFMFKNLFLKK